MSEKQTSSPAKLLKPDGDITDELARCLEHIFAKYCTPTVELQKDNSITVTTPSPGACLLPDGLDRFAIETNGEILTKEGKEEIVEFFDCTDTGDLTLKGFLQLYQLQTSVDEEETWKDLEKHGFDRNLQLKRR